MGYEIGIVGYGYVGRAVHRCFGEQVTNIYDPYVDSEVKEQTKEINDVVFRCDDDLYSFNDCDMIVVCVMTKAEDNGSCDASVVEATLRWLKGIRYRGIVLIKSAVSPLNVERLFYDFHKKHNPDGLCIVISPEYIGEGKYFVPPWRYPHPTDMKQHTFQIFGGDKEDTSKCYDIFVRTVGPHVDIYQTDEITASIVKYMENSWGATKVTFCQEWYDLCKKFKVDYNEVRELWTRDERVEKMHTAVFPDSRGYGGKCFPKDVKAILYDANMSGVDMELLSKVDEVNKKISKAGKE
jgi:nucleotide sugar dehydrogenase